MRHCFLHLNENMYKFLSASILTLGHILTIWLSVSPYIYQPVHTLPSPDIFYCLPSVTTSCSCHYCLWWRALLGAHMLPNAWQEVLLMDSNGLQNHFVTSSTHSANYCSQNLSKVCFFVQCEPKSVCCIFNIRKSITAERVCYAL